MLLRCHLLIALTGHCSALVEATGCSKIFSCLKDENELTLQDRLSQLKRPRSWYYLLTMHALSFGVLIAYAVTIYDKLDQGRYVGVVVALSVVALDVYLHPFRMVGMLKANDLSLWTGLLGECLVRRGSVSVGGCMAARVALIAAGHSRWFLGVSALFCVLACTLIIGLLEVWAAARVVVLLEGLLLHALVCVYCGVLLCALWVWVWCAISPAKINMSCVSASVSCVSELCQ